MVGLSGESISSACNVTPGAYLEPSQAAKAATSPGLGLRRLNWRGLTEIDAYCLIDKTKVLSYLAAGRRLYSRGPSAAG